MPATNISLAEEVLALPLDQRARLAHLLIDSLADDDPRTDEEIQAGLLARHDDLLSGKDPGLGFEEVFGKKP
jgi:putative addiction module component (TIGR02574 family)